MFKKIYVKIIIIALLTNFFSFEVSAVGENHDFAYFSLALEKSTFFDPEIISFNLQLTSSSSPINAIQSSIKFDPKMLSLGTTTMGNSMCPIVAEEIINNVNGEYFLTCGTPIENASNTEQIVKLTFNKLQSGISQIIVNGESQALLSDGLGTQIISFGETHNIYILK